RPQDHGGGDSRRVDAQHARRAAFKRMELLSRIEHVTQTGPSPREVGFAGLGNADAAGSPVKEPYAQPGFEVADRLTQRRGRYLEGGRRRSETAVLRLIGGGGTS